ncbi:hypothetical protein H4219_000651 [Mycoemilia scoparia]|uniref:Amino acid transporter transmembrane domain-containing protein n=1 Tax=Mycoemilia scoparia TaxID=417184 RepID=A0A9W8A256_9FUNG|nr:hypothetical protein H4219_000651 [Mycoemilia scoparia]
MSSPRPRNINIKGKGKESDAPQSQGDVAGSFSSSPAFAQATQMLSEMPSSFKSQSGFASLSIGGAGHTPEEGMLAPGPHHQALTPSIADSTNHSAAEATALLTQEEAARRLKLHLVTRPASGVYEGIEAKGAETESSILSDDKGKQPSSEFARSRRSRKSARPDTYVEDEDDKGNEGDVNEDDGYYDNDGQQDVDNSESVTVDPLTLPSGDVTHQLYKWQEQADESMSVRGLNRARSFSAIEPSVIQSDSEWDIPFMHNQIVQPGGFRRHFMRERAWREGRPPPNMLTSNFVDFIGLYGHFAGGHYPSDEDDDIVEIDEEEALYYQGSVQQQNYGSIPGSRDGVHRRRRRTRHSALSGEEGDGRHSRTKSQDRSSHATASAKKAFFLLIKSFVGTGVLFLPRAFYNGGLGFSSLLLVSVGAIALHCMLLLVECYHKYSGSYGDLGYKLYGEPMRQAILASIVISQLGFCCAYTIFVATNMRDLWNSITDCKYNISIVSWVLIQQLAYVPMAMVRKIKNFSLMALVADVFIVLGLGYLFYHDFAIIARDGPAPDVKQFNYEKFPLFIGTAVFSFEGIGLIIPVVDGMKHPEKFARVLLLTLLVCGVIFISAGAFSYLAFGSKVETVILLNLPSNGWTSSVQFVYSLAILFSVPLQLFPAIRILEAGIFVHSGKGNPIVKWQKNAFRFGLAMMVAGVAIFGAKKLDLFVSLIGSFACVPLSFIYPSMLHYKGLATTTWTRLKDIILAVFGTLVMIYVTMLTVRSWASGDEELFDRCDIPPTP